MRAKKRHPEAMLDSKGNTRRIYLFDRQYDQLLKESAELDISFSELVRKKLDSYDEIRFLVLKNRGGMDGNTASK